MDIGLDTVTSSLQEALQRSELGDNQHLAALETTSWLAQGSQLTGLLRALQDDPRAAALCARQSYLHPLGFHKILLVNAVPLFELRLHVWWPDNSAGADHIHNHRSPFISTVVKGTYDMQVFQADPAGEPVLEYREIVSQQKGWDLTPVGAARLRMITSTRLAQGTSYALTADVLHRVCVPAGALCITLMLRTALSESPTQVFTEANANGLVATPIHAMSESAYRQQLAALLTELTR